MKIWSIQWDKTGSPSKLWQCPYYYVDAPHDRLQNISRKNLMGTAQEGYVLSWTHSGSESAQKYTYLSKV